MNIFLGNLLLCKNFGTRQKIAKSKASVLITGESGVGKEVIADAILTYQIGMTNLLLK